MILILMRIGNNKTMNIKKNIFNKKIFILPCLIVSATCGCCKNVNRRTNYIVPGIFLGNDEKNPTMKIKMVISEISKEEYLSYDGLNVIEDLVKEGFYKIDLYSFLENGENVVIDMGVVNILAFVFLHPVDNANGYWQADDFIETVLLDELVDVGLAGTLGSESPALAHDASPGGDFLPCDFVHSVVLLRVFWAIDI